MEHKNEQDTQEKKIPMPLETPKSANAQQKDIRQGQEGMDAEGNTHAEQKPKLFNQEADKGANKSAVSSSFSNTSKDHANQTQQVGGNNSSMKMSLDKDSQNHQKHQDGEKCSPQHEKEKCDSNHEGKDNHNK